MDYYSCFVFVGLGNPGKQYEMTRHNMGYLVVQELAQQMGLHFKEDRRFDALIAKGVIEGKPVHLIMPTTYMNLSGYAVRKYLDFFKLKTEHLVVVTDDIALPFGQMRLKTMGSAGGHNGLKSIQQHLNTTQYARLRMGIGHPGASMLADYVLDTFSKEELVNLKMFIDRGTGVLKLLLKERINRVMNTVNISPEGVTREQDLTKPIEG